MDREYNRFGKPNQLWVDIYFQQKGIPVAVAADFYKYCESVGWRDENTHKKMNWKDKANIYSWAYKRQKAQRIRALPGSILREMLIAKMKDDNLRSG